MKKGMELLVMPKGRPAGTGDSYGDVIVADYYIKKKGGGKKQGSPALRGRESLRLQEGKDGGRLLIF